MKYTLDTEFNGYRGELMSLALVREDHSAENNASLYLVLPRPRNPEPFVKDKVMPYLDAVPRWCPIQRIYTHQVPQAIEKFLQGDREPTIIVDWPDDIKYFSRLLLTGPGTMINIPRLEIRMHRIDAYPTSLERAVQHNAWWDAWALMVKARELQLE